MNNENLTKFLKGLTKYGDLELLSGGSFLRYIPFSKRCGEEIVIERLYEPYKEAVLEASSESLEEILDYLSESYDVRSAFLELFRTHGEVMAEVVDIIRERAEKGFVMTRDGKLEPVTRLAIGRFLPDDWNPSYAKLIKLSECFGIELADLIRGYETGVYLYREDDYYTGRFCTKAELRSYLLANGIKPNRFLMTGSMADYRTLSLYASSLALRVPEMLELAMGVPEREVYIPMRFLKGPGAEKRYKRQKEALNG